MRILFRVDSPLEMAIQNGFAGVACALLSKGIAANEMAADA